MTDISKFLEAQAMDLVRVDVSENLTKAASGVPDQCGQTRLMRPLSPRRRHATRGCRVGPAPPLPRAALPRRALVPCARDAIAGRYRGRGAGGRKDKSARDLRRQCR